jgi:hypothetical protein
VAARILTFLAAEIFAAIAVRVFAAVCRFPRDFARTRSLNWQEEQVTLVELLCCFVIRIAQKLSGMWALWTAFWTNFAYCHLLARRILKSLD